jgi:hypothetical protein
LQRERCTLQEWLREEWECFLLAINNAGRWQPPLMILLLITAGEDVALIHQLKARMMALKILCVTW